MHRGRGREVLLWGSCGGLTLGEGATRVRGQAPRTHGSDRGRCHAWADWYDLHANVRISARDRAGLERLCRYIARPPLSQKRLRELPDGRIALGLKRAWDDGTTAIVLTPLQLLERLAAIVPHPRHNLVVYHGVLAARHRWRSLVVPSPVTSGRRCKWIPWADLLKRTFGVDALLCPVCGGRLELRALVRTHEVSAKLLGAAKQHTMRSSWGGPGSRSSSSHVQPPTAWRRTGTAGEPAPRTPGGLTRSLPDRTTHRSRGGPAGRRWNACYRRGVSEVVRGAGGGCGVGGAAVRWKRKDRRGSCPLRAAPRGTIRSIWWCRVGKP